MLTLSLQANEKIDILFSEWSQNKLFLKNINILCIDGYKFVYIVQDKGSSIVQMKSDDNMVVRCENSKDKE